MKWVRIRQENPESPGRREEQAEQGCKWFRRTEAGRVWPEVRPNQEQEGVGVQMVL